MLDKERSNPNVSYLTPQEAWPVQPTLRDTGSLATGVPDARLGGASRTLQRRL